MYVYNMYVIDERGNSDWITNSPSPFSQNMTAIINCRVWSTRRDSTWLSNG